MKYNGIELKKESIIFLQKLESILEKKLIYKDFFNEDFWDFTGFFSQNGQITHLSIQGTDNFFEFPIEITNLNKLKMLVLIDLPIDHIQEEIFNLNTIEIFYLMYCTNIKEIPKSIKQLESLEGLNLSYNSLKSIPKVIGKIKTLKELDLSNNQLTSLPNEIGRLKDLETLTISNNHLSNLPNSIGDLVSLKTLYLNDNNLTSLPDSIQNLNFLTWLELRNNELKGIPDFILNLNSLENFDITNNKISKITDVARKLENKGVRISL
jgi:Leucine-rich repeat (LRR) protein